VHPTLGILARFQASFYTSAFPQSDGVPPPAPARVTQTDIWIENTAENAQRLLSALEQFGFGSLGLSEQDFLTPEQIIQLGYPPNRIDLITSLPGVSFEECFQSRLNVEVDGVMVHFIDLEHLKQNKRATGRFQDLADLENLEGGDED